MFILVSVVLIGFVLQFEWDIVLRLTNGTSPVDCTDSIMNIINIIVET